jgi:DNA-binding transcriptional ArsR family regulator
MNKSYYAIIPADVRYDARLTPNAKLLYGEITALCNEKGFCWAMNEYFADLYSVSKVSVSKWVGSLRDCGYIECQMQYKEGTKQITARYIRLTTPIKENLGTLLKKSLIPSQRKVNDPIKEKFKDNNTSNNTINTTGDKSPELSQKFKIPTVEEVTDYCRERNNTLDAQNFIDFYSSKGWLVGKNKMKDWQACIRTWETNDKKRAKENANKQTASDKRSDYASNFYDYDKATDF